MTSDQAADLAAVGIYAVMSRDVGDALDMINECADARTLETLHAMLTTKGRPNTDQELNDLMVGPTRRRLDALRPTLGQVMARAARIPDVGDHEIVVGPDGLAHMLIVSSIEHAITGAGLAGSLGFVCPCMGIPVGTDVDALVIAPYATCIRCLSL